LPRRERRILEYLIANRGRRVTKTQIFNAIYGIFDEDVEENVVESHISKLRKKLRKKLGVDPSIPSASLATASIGADPTMGFRMCGIRYPKTGSRKAHPIVSP
jgi:hypothetical protein